VKKNCIIGNVKLDLLKIQESQPVKNVVYCQPSISSTNVFSEWEDDYCESAATSSYEDELKSYIQNIERFDKNKNLLEWWTKLEKIFYRQRLNRQ